MKKIVLAYSGGLDTTYCLKYLSLQNHQVHTVLVNTGGFDLEQLQIIGQRAIEIGSNKHTNLDISEEFYQKAIKFMVFGNVLKNNSYPLSVSAERVFQAIAIVNYAKSIGADAIAHGSTGAGNDQVRFDMIFQILYPNVEIITPIRDQKLSRAQEIDFLNQNGVNINWEKAKYSINKGIWGTSIGGVETLSSNLALPESAFPSQLLKNKTEKLTLGFNKGQIDSVNGIKAGKLELINKIEEICSAYAIGRDMHVGDTVIGIKGRVAFEAAAAIVIIKAHQTLEKHVLSKWQIFHKTQLSDFYGMLMHEGQYLEPLMRDIEAFLESSQKNVSGLVELNLKPYTFEIVGVDSPFDLMNNSFGEYGEQNKLWNSEDAKGFIRILSVPGIIYNAVQNQNIYNHG